MINHLKVLLYKISQIQIPQIVDSYRETAYTKYREDNPFQFNIAPFQTTLPLYIPYIINT